MELGGNERVWAIPCNAWSSAHRQENPEHGIRVEKQPTGTIRRCRVICQPLSPLSDTPWIM